MKKDTALHNSSVTVPRVPLPWDISTSRISNTADWKPMSLWLTSTPSSRYSIVCKFCPGFHLNISKPTVFFVTQAIHPPIFPGITTAMYITPALPTSARRHCFLVSQNLHPTFLRPCCPTSIKSLTASSRRSHFPQATSYQQHCSSVAHSSLFSFLHVKIAPQI